MSLQVQGTLHEHGEQVDGVEITGQWDQQISVKTNEGTNCIWKAPQQQCKDPRWEYFLADFFGAKK